MSLRSSVQDYESERVLALVMARMLDDPTLLPKIGRFEVEERIGQGGMGEVYRCRDAQLQRLVAIKLLTGVDPARGEQLRREARALAQLSHPNVVQVYEVGEHQGAAYLAMEYVEGRTFEQWLKTKPEPRQIVRRYIEAGRGVAAAHAAGLVHLDFKPANVLLGRDGRVRVVDFGLARQLEYPTESDHEPGHAGPSAETRPTRLGGTPRYMSPEQVLGEEVGEASDQFSFCVALFEALWGVRPVSGASLAEREAGVDTPLVTPRGHRAVYRVLRRGLARAPDERYANMDALVAALEAIPRRRQRLAWVGALGLGALMAVAWASEREAPPEPTICTVGLAGVWDQERALPTRYAPEAWAKISTTIDSWAQAWTEESQQVCAGFDTDLDAQASTLLVARAACLNDQRASMAHLLEDLGNAGPETLAATIDRVDVLATEDCHRLALGPELGSSISADLLALLVEVELDAIGRARFRGDFEQAQGRLEALERDFDVITATDNVEIIAERAKLCDALGDDGCARRHYQRAFELAEGLGLTRQRAQWALARLDLELGESIELEDARVWLGLAEQAVDDAPEPKTSLRARLDYARGCLAEEAGDQAGAGRHFEQALRLVGDASPDASAYLGALVDLHLDRDAERALEFASRSLGVAEARYGPQHPKSAHARLRRGLALAELGELDDARAEFEQAIEIWTRFERGLDVAQAEILLAQFALGEGSLDRAEAHADKAQAVIDRRAPSNHRLEGQLELVRAYVARGRGHSELALSHARAAQSTLEQGSRRLRTWELAQAHLLLGELLLEVGALDEAGHELTRVLALEPRASVLAVCHLQLGELALRRGELDQAGRHLAKSESLGLVPGNQPIHALLRVLVEIRSGLEPSVVVDLERYPYPEAWLEALGLTQAERKRIAQVD